MNNNGHIKLRRGLLKHIEQGRLTTFDTGIYTRILLEADYRSGIWWGSASKLLALASADSSPRRVRASLQHLDGIGFLRRFWVRGRHGNYPVLINKFECSDGAMKGMRLNAEKSDDWRHPVYEFCDDEGSGKGSDGAPSQKEEEGRKRKKKEGTKASPLPLAFQGIELGITEKEHRGFVAAFPSLDLQQEYRVMDAWLVANPKKPKKSHARFALNWLKGSEDDRKDRQRQQAGQDQQREMVRARVPA
jgi:hypothetical protein